MTKRERDELNLLVGKLYVYMTKHRRAVREGDYLPRHVENLARVGRSLHRSYENACNGDLSKAQETRQANLEDEARAIVARLRFLTGADIRIHFNGDPRGYPIKLDLPPMRKGERPPANEWGGQWGIG